ncbi:MAG: YihA family ribosome biogenesis GTP-binding protein [Ruminococcaceae bacterium]|nr:YihA family ribosome biogenesis GTP-binding protein [Oscillospiraceae bacterium]
MPNLNLQKAALLISAGEPRQFPAHPIPQIALSGRSNVGKSSLINTLLGRKALARVSQAPGKTITVNFYDVDKKLFLVDLPGYGFAKRPPQEKEKWSALTDGYFTANKNIDRVALILQLVDLKVGPTKDDVMMLDYLTQTGLPFAVVATKADKLNKTERAKALAALATHPAIPTDTPVIPFSALNGEGKEEVWKTIFAHADIK